ncbi:MAG: response regulator [Bacteroidia bacterium]|nr:response regulator [Bacteroidia bacterium]
MESPLRILVVEDEMIIAAKIAMHLNQMGYEVVSIMPSGVDAVAYCKESLPDIILMDINLRGEMDGIQTVEAIQKFAEIPVIYLTANADDQTFQRAKSTRPFSFIAKPYKKMDLQRSIELVEQRMVDSPVPAAPNSEAPYLLEDRIFVRHKDTMVKIFLMDICYLTAERSYCRIITKGMEYLVSEPLKQLEEKLPPEYFLRVHRSHVVNLKHVDEVSDTFIIVDEKLIPLSKSYKNEFFQRIRMV